MTHAPNTGILQHNPLSGIRSVFLAPKVTNIPTIKPNELGKLMKEISYASIKLVTRCLIEWQLHTMTPPGETHKTEWSEIDLENKLWVITVERMKMRLEHQVPLTEQAIEILERLNLLLAIEIIYSKHISTIKDTVMLKQQTKHLYACDIKIE